MGKMNINLCGITLDNPVMAASGTFGYGYEFAELYDINGWEPSRSRELRERPGSATRRRGYHGNATAGMINAVGLQNPGVDKVIEEELPKLAKVLRQKGHGQRERLLHRRICGSMSQAGQLRPDRLAGSKHKLPQCPRRRNDFGTHAGSGGGSDNEKSERSRKSRSS